MRKIDEITDPESCLNKAAKDEPVFVLRANDPLAPAIVRSWANAAAHKRCHEPEKIEDARSFANLMENYRQDVESGAIEPDHSPLTEGELFLLGLDPDRVAELAEAMQDAASGPDGGTDDGQPGSDDLDDDTQPHAFVESDEEGNDSCVLCGGMADEAVHDIDFEEVGDHEPQTAGSPVDSEASQQ